MSPEQALEILNKATAVASLSRNDHAAVIQALEVLKKLAASQKKEGEV